MYLGTLLSCDSLIECLSKICARFEIFESLLLSHALCSLGWFDWPIVWLSILHAKFLALLKKGFLLLFWRFSSDENLNASILDFVMSALVYTLKRVHYVAATIMFKLACWRWKISVIFLCGQNTLKSFLSCFDACLYSCSWYKSIFYLLQFLGSDFTCAWHFHLDSMLVIFRQ